MSDMNTTQQRGDAPPPPPKARAPELDPKAVAEAKEAQAAGSIGAQVILDFNSDSGLGARGGAATTLEENQMARDAHLTALGLDPVNCSGPPPSPEVLKARREAEKARAAAPREPTQDPKATRMSSLAAGIAPDLPEAPPGNGAGGGGATAPVNTAVPAVTQTGSGAGSTLQCTMGTWDGEPTSYSYAWTINGNAAGTDAATYDVQVGDAGGTAVCTVTATNAAGSTAAPPSNGVVVA